MLPDGTIAYAENPPKKYQDIYPLNFDNDPDGPLRRGAARGPALDRPRRQDLSRRQPAHQAARLLGVADRTGQGQPIPTCCSCPRRSPARPACTAWPNSASRSPTRYFTWRTAKWELTEFGNEIAEHADYARPNLFVNTPDILHESLQHGGPGMFAIRAVLAATMSPSWGVYSGYELFEHRPVREGSEEYLDSEKYELRPRDFAGALAEGESLEPFIDAAQRDSPAASRAAASCAPSSSTTSTTTRCWPTASSTRSTGDCVLVVVTLNAFGPEEATLWLDMAALGMEPYERFWVRDEITGEEYQWGQANYVRLDPAQSGRPHHEHAARAGRTPTHAAAQGVTGE